jgi:hypothetical protein
MGLCEATIARAVMIFLLPMKQEMVAILAQRTPTLPFVVSSRDI